MPSRQAASSNCEYCGLFPHGHSAVWVALRVFRHHIAGGGNGSACVHGIGCAVSRLQRCDARSIQRQTYYPVNLGSTAVRASLERRPMLAAAEAALSAWRRASSFSLEGSLQPRYIVWPRLSLELNDGRSGPACGSRVDRSRERSAICPGDRWKEEDAQQASSCGKGRIYGVYVVALAAAANNCRSGDHRGNAVCRP